MPQEINRVLRNQRNIRDTWITFIAGCVITEWYECGSELFSLLVWDGTVKVYATWIAECNLFLSVTWEEKSELDVSGRAKPEL